MNQKLKRKHSLWLTVLMFLPTYQVTGENTFPLKEDSDFVFVCMNAGAGGHEGLPDVCRLKDGRLLCVFYAGYAHDSPPNKVLPKGGRIVYCFSADQGRTWNHPLVMYDSHCDDRDPSLSMMSSDAILRWLHLTIILF